MGYPLSCNLTFRFKGKIRGQLRCYIAILYARLSVKTLIMLKSTLDLTLKVRGNISFPSLFKESMQKILLNFTFKAWYRHAF